MTQGQLIGTTNGSSRAQGGGHNRECEERTADKDDGVVEAEEGWHWGSIRWHQWVPARQSCTGPQHAAVHSCAAASQRFLSIGVLLQSASAAPLSIGVLQLPLFPLGVLSCPSSSLLTTKTLLFSSSPRRRGHRRVPVLLLPSVPIAFWRSARRLPGSLLAKRLP